MNDDAHPDDAKEQKLRREWTAWRCDWERALIRFSALSSTDLAVGIEIARHARAETKQAWPAQSTIAENLSRSLPSVQRSVSRLVRLGFLSVRRRPSNNGHAFNVYTLLEERIERYLDQDQALKDASQEEVRRLVRLWAASCKEQVSTATGPTHTSDTRGTTADLPITSEGGDPSALIDKHLMEHVSYISSEEEGLRGDADFDDPWAA